MPPKSAPARVLRVPERGTLVEALPPGGLRGSPDRSRRRGNQRLLSFIAVMGAVGCGLSLDFLDAVSVQYVVNVFLQKFL